MNVVAIPPHPLRRSVLAAGAAAFLLMITALLPAHLAHDDFSDFDQDCNLCLQVAGNPAVVDHVTCTPSLDYAGAAALAAPLPVVAGAPTLPRGRAPPVPVS